MPHPREVADALLSTTQQIISPETSKPERTALLTEYREYLIWVYGRLAQIHNRLLPFIHAHPDAEFAEVEEELADLGLDEGETQLLWSIYNEFHSRREARNLALESLQAGILPTLKENFGELPDHLVSDFMARSVFSILTQGHIPEGNVELVDLPFAVGIKFDDPRDMETIEGEADVLARYIDDLEVTPGVRASLILIGPNCDESSFLHEETHGVNAAVFAGLLFEDAADEFWGGDIRDQTTIEEVMGGDRNLDDQKILAIVEQLIPRILANAKDEVIAYFSAEETFTKAITYLWQQHVSDDLKLEENVVYGFLASLGLKPELFSPGHQRHIYNLIVDEFNGAILHNVGFLRRLWGAVKFENEERISKSDLISFMRFVPLLQWQRLGRHVFTEQLDELTDATQSLEQKMEYWLTQASLLEEEYMVYALLANGMSIEGFAEQALVGTREIRKISAEAMGLVEEFQRLVPLIEEGIGQMKDLSLRHDLFDEQALYDLGASIQGYFFELVAVRDQLNPYVLRSVRYKN